MDNIDRNIEIWGGCGELTGAYRVPAKHANQIILEMRPHVTRAISQEELNIDLAPNIAQKRKYCNLGKIKAWENF